MHKGVMDPKGVKLSAAQVKRLLTAITVSQPAQARTNCYKPHHAFVFFDAKGRVAAVFEMCFGCNQFVATPPGTPEYIDTTDLYRLAHELGSAARNGKRVLHRGLPRRRKTAAR